MRLGNERMPEHAREVRGSFSAESRLCTYTHPLRPRAGSKVVLFNDTFTNYNEPVIGIAALKIPDDTGAQVFVPDVAKRKASPSGHVRRRPRRKSLPDPSCDRPQDQTLFRDFDWCSPGLTSLTSGDEARC